jgi:TonB family protein
MEAMRYKRFMNKLWAHVKRHWSLPPSLKGRNIKATVVVFINREGTITSYEVEETSGVASFDQSSVRAILLADPLPPVPSDIPDSFFSEGIGFVFSE